METEHIDRRLDYGAVLFGIAFIDVDALERIESEQMAGLMAVAGDVPLIPTHRGRGNKSGFWNPDNTDQGRMTPRRIRNRCRLTVENSAVTFGATTDPPNPKSGGFSHLRIIRIRISGSGP
uniref:RES domain-containing protein n=1 Tax=Panagrellus redivivus TaxID=6233 RepID=A0A7E4WB67_PANRE